MKIKELPDESNALGMTDLRASLVSVTAGDGGFWWHDRDVCWRKEAGSDISHCLLTALDRNQIALFIFVVL